MITAASSTVLLRARSSVSALYGLALIALASAFTHPLVLLAVRSGGEIDVEGDRARACLVEPFNDLRIMLAIPRPPLDGGNARRIHLDYVDLTAGGVRAHREACILQHVFKRL